MKRKGILVFSMAFMIISVFVLITPVMATSRGNCGDNLTWTLDDEDFCTTKVP